MKFWDEILYSFRSSWKKPAFSLSVIFTLALGISASTIMFSLVHSIFLRPLPFQDPDKLVTIWNRYGKEKEVRSYIAAPDYFDRVEQSKTLEQIAAYTTSRMDLTGKGEPVRLHCALVTSSFFPLLGVAPFRGRFILPEEDIPEKNVVMLSYGFWQSALGASSAVLNESIQLNGKPYTVVGIMPAFFQYPGSEIDAWLPVGFRPDQKLDTERGNENLIMLGRMKKGVNFSAVKKEMEIIAARVPQNVPDRREFLLNSGWSAITIPLDEFLTGKIRPTLLILTGAVGFLFLIVCANVSHLLLVRSLGRRKEIAIRVALGAGKWPVFRTILTETFLLVFAGAIAAVLLTIWGLKVIRNLIPLEFAGLADFHLTLPVFLFAILISATTAFILGLLIFYQIVKVNPQFYLHSGAQGSQADRMSSSYRTLLVTCELALALILSSAAVFMIQSFVNLFHENPGFRSEKRMCFSISLPQTRYPDASHRTVFYSQLQERIRSLPGIESAGATSLLPLQTENWTATFSLQDHPLQSGESPPGFEYRIVTPGYFSAMGIPVKMGRDFNDSDNRSHSLVAIVDEEIATKFWPSGNAIGKKIGYSDSEDRVEWREIVGIAGSIRNESIQTPGKGQVYFPHAQMSLRSMTFVVHSLDQPLDLVPAIRLQVLQMDPELPIDEINRVERIVSQSIGTPRFHTTMLVCFACIALILGIIGVYGVTSFVVKQQTAEIGIRMALGASQNAVLREVLFRGIYTAMAGIALGIAGILALSRIVSMFLFNVHPRDPVIIVGSAAAIFLVNLLACYFPARSASRVSPLFALRYE